MTAGLIALAVALAVATVLGLALRRRAGRFKAGSPRAGSAGTGSSALTEADLGSRLGERATLVQFSTAFCAACRPTRHILARIADSEEGVTLVEIDAEARLDLARRLNVSSTPTVLVLGPDGGIVRRATGRPRQADVIAALGAAGVCGPGGYAAGTGGE